MTDPSVWDDLHEKGLQWDQIATDSSNPDGLTGNAIRKRVQRWKHSQHNPLPSFPQFSQRIYNDYLVVETDNAIISSDWEIPDTDGRMMRLALELGKKYKIKQHIIAGDLIATDQQIFSTHKTTWRDNHDLTYENAIKITQEAINVLSRQFEISIIEGNHDNKIGRATDGEIHIGMFLTNATYSRYFYCWLKTSRGYMMICHPRQYARNAAGLGQRLYNSILTPEGGKPRFLVLGHTHQSQYAWSEDGLCEVFSLGCLRDYNKTKYVSQSINTYPKWNQSLLMLLNGYAYAIGLNSDLKFWLGEKLAREI